MKNIKFKCPNFHLYFPAECFLRENENSYFYQLTDICSMKLFRGQKKSVIKYHSNRINIARISSKCVWKIFHDAWKIP